MNIQELYKVMILAYTLGQDQKALELAKQLLESSLKHKAKLRDANHIVKVLSKGI